MSQERARQPTRERGPIESNVFAATPIAEKSEIPVVLQNLGGRWYVGYTGDVNAEEGTTAVVSAMFKLP